jgi:uncharacterized protein (DUF2062 family)
MKFGMGVPAWLGALLAVGPPGAITGFIMGQYEAMLPVWVLVPAGLLILVLSCIAWFGVVSWFENRRDQKKEQPHQTTSSE